MTQIYRALFGYRCDCQLVPKVPIASDDQAPKYALEINENKLFGGWYRIQYHQGAGDGLARPVVTVTHDSSRKSQIPLGIAETEPLTWIGRIHGPISLIELHERRSGEACGVPGFELMRIGAIELGARAFSKNPLSAIQAAATRLCGEKARSRLILTGLFDADPADGNELYRIWRSINERPEASKRLKEVSAAWLFRPKFSLLMAVGQPPPKQLLAAISAVLGQSYREFQLVIALPAGAGPELKRVVDESAGDPRLIEHIRNDGEDFQALFAATLDASTSDFIATVGDTDLLAEDALLRLSNAVNESRRLPDMIYGDNDKIDDAGNRSAPNFKPEANRELLFAQDYIGSPCVFRVAWLRETGIADGLSDLNPDYALKLQLINGNPPSSIRHIPAVLYHQRTKAKVPQINSGNAAAADRRSILQARLSRHAPDCLVESGRFETNRVKYPLPDPPPLISLIVPTRDQLELTRQCVNGLLNATSYPNIEVLIVNNDSRQPETLRWFSEIETETRVTILEWSGTFNYAAINNHAVASANGSLIGLINNDIEIIDAQWLTEMTSLAVRPEIGAVGAKLLYPDGRVQHAGIFLGIGGVAGHGHKFFDKNAAGYQTRLASAQYVSAVTAACLVVDKAKFLAADGLDADNLAVAFNDVDFCLKLAASGLKNIYTPHATLIHHESASRGDDLQGDKAVRFRAEAEFIRKKWALDKLSDPYYSPNLSRRHENFSLEIGK